MASGGTVGVTDGQLTREEVERRLAARQPMNDYTTTTVSLTLPNQLFSDIMEGLVDESILYSLKFSQMLQVILSILFVFDNMKICKAYSDNTCTFHPRDFKEEEIETSPSNIDDDITVDNYD